MTARGFQPSPQLPRWMVLTIGGVIGFHLFALGILMLSAQNGPWFVEPLGRVSPSMPPEFARVFSEWTTRHYLLPLGLVVDGHFDSNRTLVPTVRIQAHLANEEDVAQKPMTFPDPKANMWVRQRQFMLVERFADDQPHMGNQDPSVAIQAPGSKSENTFFFFPADPKDMDSELIYYQVPQYEFRRVMDKNRGYPFMGPSDSSMVLMAALVRFLEREKDAAKVDVVRESRNPCFPMLIIHNNPEFPEKIIADELVPNLPPNYLKTTTVRFNNAQPKDWRD